MTPTGLTMLSDISAKTALYAVLGSPIAHSLSPRMQTAAFAACGIDAIYLAFEVAPGELETALVGARALGVGGLNITVPHKEAACRLAAELDDSARLTGAANTLVPTKTGWRAYNTDATGFVEAARLDLGFEPKGKRVAILGAGGAARAAVAGMALAGAAELLVTNRDMGRARTMVSELAGGLKGCSVAALATEEIPERLSSGDLIVSATPLGLDPDGSWPWELGRMAKGVKLYDMAYGERPTPLTAQALAAGFEATSGQRMLLCQGAQAFHLWTGVAPPMDEMQKALYGG
jgi:shikimate dehydrogenase